IGLDGRIGRKFLNAGPGYGGSCFPKDTLALVKTAADFESPVRIIEAVVGVNDRRKRAMAERVLSALGDNAKGANVAVLGVTFKPNTDDMRDAPSLDIIPALQEAGCKITAFDPVGMDEAATCFENVTWAEGAYEALEGADCLVLITEWNEFRALQLDRLKAAMKTPLVVDLRNIYKPDEMEAAGFQYVSVGRPSVGAPD
ncbi:MAG: UDP binding domain-containing protein, partial [Pseudomonadota bacterium]